MIESLFAALETDNQLSVRYFMEWIVVLLLYKYYPSFNQLLLEQLQTVADYSLVVLMLIVLH